MGNDPTEWKYDSLLERVVATPLVYLVAIPYAVWINFERWRAERN